MVLITCLPVLGQWDKSTGNATITQTIEAGNTTEPPSSDAVNTALAGKLSIVCTGTLINPLTTAPTSDCLIPGERYAADGRLWDPTTDLITITGSGIAAANSNPDTFTDSGNGLIAIKAGMRIYGEDFTNAGNNAEFVAAADATAGSVTLRSDNAVTAEAAGSSRTLYVYNHYWAQRTPEGGWIKLEDERGVISVSTSQAVPNGITDADGIVLQADQMNSVITMTGAGDVDIPENQCDTATHKWLVVKSTAAHLNSVTSNDAADQFILANGTALDAQNELDLAGAAGSQVCIMCLQANEWWVTGYIGTPVDGGAAD